MKELIIKYVENLKKRNLSENTLDAYIRDIKRFYNFVKDREEKLTEVDNVTIMAYVQKLYQSGRAKSSIVRNIVSIRNFYKYLVKIKEIEENPTTEYEIPKIKRNIPNILSVDEVDRLLCAPQGNKNVNKGIRDKAMLEVMYATGVKVTELLNLTLYDINLKLCYIKCKGVKNKERVVPIGSYAVNCIKEYLKIREEINIYNLDYMFLNLKGTKMTRQGFWKIVKRYAKEAGINKSVDAFTLRHSFAVHLLQNGADMRSVQELLGHTNMATTQIYSSISKKNKIAEVYKKSHPRA